jgi:hypothetical protein
MKSVNKNWLYLIYFFLGCLVCYITLQFRYFDIDTKINVTETIISIGTAAIGLYIANTIQKRMTKNQNQSSYVMSKLDAIWSEFNTFSQSVIYGDNLEIVTLIKNSKRITLDLGFLKTILISYEQNISCIDELESSLEEFESYLLSLPINDNIISINQNKIEIENKVMSINQSFSIVLKLIHNI